MAKHKKQLGLASILPLIIAGFLGLGLCLTFLLQGTNIALLNDKGFMAAEERKLIVFSAAILLSVAVPTLLFLYFVAWKYRESNQKATYKPNARHGKSLVFTIWAIPTVTMLILGSVMWPATHRLEPRKVLESTNKPMTIQVISMRWKWVFIYPEQKIATVNFVQIPVDTPVTFELTADDAPMSSFWIPNLGGQLYSMTGHVNRLNLLAHTVGDYPGSTPEINGAGFADMKFVARASSKADFDIWLQRVDRSSDVLDTETYEKLLKPSEKNPAVFYSAFDAGLYDTVIKKYSGSHEHHESETHGTTHE